MSKHPSDSDPAELSAGIRRHVPTAPREVPLAGQELTDVCLEKARDLGFIRAGVVSLDPLDEGAGRLREFLAAGRHGDLSYLVDGGPRHLPQGLFAEGRAAFSVALPYPTPGVVRIRAKGESSSDPLVGRIAGYAQGRDYHAVLRDRLAELAIELANAVGRVVVSRICVDTAPLLERDVAVRAGYAFIGKNTLCIAPGAGSHFLLGEMLVDVDLLPTATRQPEGCGTCRACLDACPTGAFVGPFQIDARRCISYLTIESTAEIPRELRAAVGNRVFGCDECQAVCPHNHSSRERPIDAELTPRPALVDPDLVSLLQLTSAGYRRLATRTALRRVGRDQLSRNAAVALGNSGSRTAIEPLFAAATGHRSVEVRVHATWALGRLLETTKEEDALFCLRDLADDREPRVRAEAEWFLAGAQTGATPP